MSHDQLCDKSIDSKLFIPVNSVDIHFYADDIELYVTVGKSTHHIILLITPNVQPVWGEHSLY